MRVKDMKPGDRETFTMLLRSVSEIRKPNCTYCELTLTPSKKEPNIKAKLWNATREDVLAHVSEMQVVTLGITAKEFNNSITYTADAVRPCEIYINLNEFIVESQIPGEKMFDYSVKLLEGYGNDPSAVIATELFYQNKEKLVCWPAATNVHHAYKGGLLQHMGVVAADCKSICCCASGDLMEKIGSMEAPACLDSIYKYTKKEGGDSEIVMIALTALSKMYKGRSGLLDDDAARRKLIAMVLAKKLCGNYPFLNKGILFSAVALRGMSVVLQDGLVGVIGSHAADKLLFERNINSTHMEKEEVRILRHSLLVGEDGGEKAVCPEAYLAGAIDTLVPLVGDASETEGFSAAALVTAGAIHDIGKVRELSSDQYGVASYEVEGNLYGHTSIALSMIQETAGKMGIPLSSVSAMMHCIASHLGKKEWGALVEPESIEAKILAAIDYIDSRMEIHRFADEMMAPGEKDELVRKYLDNVAYKPLYMTAAS